MKRIKAETIHFQSDEIKAFLENMDGYDKSVRVNQLVYYPYIFFEYSLIRQSFFQPMGQAVGCTVDGINKIGALIDTSPRFLEQEVDPHWIIPKKIEMEEAEILAKSFLYESISSRKKILSLPKLILTKQELFYRPYWVAEGRLHSKKKYRLTVDAVTGKYHPI